MCMKDNISVRNAVELKKKWKCLFDKMCDCIFHHWDRQVSQLLDYCQLQSAGNIWTVKEERSVLNNLDQSAWCSAGPAALPRGQKNKTVVKLGISQVWLGANVSEYDLLSPCNRCKQQHVLIRGVESF